MSRFIRTATLALAALLAPAFAAAETEPGEEWEQTTQMEMKGMPFAMPATTYKFCKPTGDWSEPPAARKDADCKTTEVKRSGNTMKWKVVCTGEEKMEGEGEMTWSGQSYTGKMDMHMAQGDMSMKMSGKRLGKPCDAGKQRRDVQALMKRADEQQQMGTAMLCQNAVEAMTPASFTGEPPMCKDQVKKKEFCARARTRAGYGLLKQRSYDNALDVAATLCKLDTKGLEATFCKGALAEKDVGYLGPNCPDETKVLAKAECAGKSFSGVDAGYRDFCTKYAADELVKEGAKQKGKDAAVEQGKKLLKGVLGF
jgi:hypothetical protein